jgi:hypothetical protein
MLLDKYAKTIVTSERMFKRLTLFCMCLVMFSVLIVAFHHHDDGADHDDCALCGATLQHQPADLAIPIPVIHPDFVTTEFFTPATPRIVKTFSTPFNNRAPPA